MPLQKYALVALMLFSFISCSESEVSDDSEYEEVEIVDTAATVFEEPQKSTPEQFLQSLEKGEELATYFQDNWYFVYHRDNRCEGSTDGEIGGLGPRSIDFIIVLEVHNDGDSWSCEKTEPITYEFEFDLDKELDHWDRFEIVKYEDQHPDVTFIHGAGESDYMKLHYNEEGLINTVEYMSEDPG